MITAPFNFVPLSEKVFFPDWAEKVSHDVPFEDGESGIIDITITAKSPMFIRNHSDNGDNQSTKFCNHNGEYYIPSTSIKGMIRNVLEIMSFSKIDDDKFNDHSYAFRDLNNKTDYMSEMKPAKTFCGWLKKCDNKYVIEDCGIPGRIRLDKIDSTFSSRFNHSFDEKKDDNKTAEYKYSILEDTVLPTHFTHKKNDNGREIYIQGSDKEGTIVFTGQPSKRKEGENPSGKIYEFIFFETKQELPLDEKIVDNFKFAYFDDRKTQPKESMDWSYWKEKLFSGERIPIFFQKDNNEEVKHFGLSYLYKLPYANSIKDAIKSISDEHFDERLDLAQSIFGYIDDNRKKSMKGRVNFSHFKVDGLPTSFKEITTVLGTPRASYYPIYIKQDYEEGDRMVKDGEYNTLAKNKSQISGRKRYPLHHGIPDPKQYKKEDKSATTFTPLGSYNNKKEFNEFTFSGKLRYHNLKEIELGAMLSALTYHGYSDNFYHNIGMAKSLGFGKIKIDISLDINKQIRLLQKYEEAMDKELNGKWLKSKQIKELFTMSNKDINIDHKLKYLVLNPKNNTDAFRDAKSNKKYLPLTSNISKLDNNLKSIFNKDRIESFLDKEKQKQIEITEQKERLQSEKELLSATPHKASDEFKNAIESYVRDNCKLAYYNYSDLKKVFEGNEDDIFADDIYNAYMDLTKKESFGTIEKLLLKRDRETATDIELAELYRLLKK